MSKRKNIIYNILIVVFIAMFMFSTYMVIKPYINSYIEQRNFESIDKKRQKDEKSFFNSNKDVVAWISIPKTKINYPVMFTPDNPQYYLRRDFNKKWKISGTPFLGEGCYLNCDNMIIYAHNMKTGIMFGGLDKFSKKEYYETHPYIYIDTKKWKGHYKVVAAFKSEIYRHANKGFEYYNYGGDFTSERYTEFSKQVDNSKNYDTGVRIKKGDKIVTLSTCAYHKKDGRFVVIAKLMKKEFKSEKKI